MRTFPIAAFFVGHVAVLLLAGGVTTVRAAGCEELLGSWSQTHFGEPVQNANMQPDSGGGATLVITSVKADCTFTAELFGKSHTITGRIGQNSSDNVSMVVTRTDGAGCVNHLYGKLFLRSEPQVFEPKPALSYWITSSEPKCGMGAGHREARWFGR